MQPYIVRIDRGALPDEVEAALRLAGVQVLRRGSQLLVVADSTELERLADIDGNSSVNVSDLLAVINAWGPCGNPNNCPADIAPPGPPVGDDSVNVSDLLAVINAWGACP